MRASLHGLVVVITMGLLAVSPGRVEAQRVAKAKEAAARLGAKAKVKASWVRSKVTGKPSRYRDGQVISLGRKVSVGKDGRTTEKEQTMRVGPRGRLTRHETRTIESGGGKPTFRAVDQHETNRRFFKVDHAGGSDFQITSFQGRGRNRIATHTVSEKTDRRGRVVETGILDRVNGTRETTTFHRNGARTITQSAFSFENGVGAERIVSQRTVPAVDRIGKDGGAKARGAKSRGKRRRAGRR